MTYAKISRSSTLETEIIDALHEANIMEFARASYEKDNMLTVAMGLSGAPYSFVEHVYNNLEGTKL